MHFSERVCFPIGREGKGRLHCAGVFVPKPLPSLNVEY